MLKVLTKCPIFVCVGYVAQWGTTGRRRWLRHIHTINTYKYIGDEIISIHIHGNMQYMFYK